MPSIKSPRGAASFFAPDLATAKMLELMHAQDRFLLHAQGKSAALIDGIEQQNKLLKVLKKASLEGKNFDDLKEELKAAKPGHDEARLRTVFNINMRTAYNAGRYEQQMKGSKPFFRYVSVGDSRVRDEHAAFHGLVLPKDDAFWDANYPPNGFNCRCKVQAIGWHEVDRLGAKLPKSAPPDIPQGGFKSGVRGVLAKSKEAAVQAAIDIVNDKLAKAQITKGAAYEAVQSELKELKSVRNRMKMFDEVLERQAKDGTAQKGLMHPLGTVNTVDGQRLPLYISDETIYSHFGKSGKHKEITSFELAMLPQAVQNIKMQEFIDPAKSKEHKDKNGNNVGYYSLLGKWWKIAIKITESGEAFVSSMYRDDPRKKDLKL